MPDNIDFQRTKDPLLFFDETYKEDRYKLKEQDKTVSEKKYEMCLKTNTKLSH